MVAAEARVAVAEQQAVAALPWMGITDQANATRLMADYRDRAQRAQAFHLGGPQKRNGLDDPRHALQENGGDILCHPILVLPYLQAFDKANAQIGAERNHTKTEVICYVTDLHPIGK